MVQASWWHRLIIVLIGLGGLGLGLISLYLVYATAQEYTYHYSWRGELPSGQGLHCLFFTYQDVDVARVSCGDFEDPTEMLKDVAKHKRIPLSELPGPRSRVDDARTLEHLSTTTRLAYEGRSEFRLRNVWKPLGVAVGVLFGYFVLAGAGFRMILWIAHGDTDLKF